MAILKDPPHRPDWIGLAFSGGGFRATLFHLGVVRYLFERRLLSKVRLICSVSGGSILAAHLSLNWQKYNGTDSTFDDVAHALIDFTRLDLRGRIVRRWLCGTTLVLPRILGRLAFTSLLEKYYSRLYDNADLGALNSMAEQPDVHLLATSLTTGDLCKFNSEGFTSVSNGIERLIRNSSIPLALAVASSSAFPPLFPPIPITKDLLNTNARDFDNTQFLTDGGVFDNLGFSELSRLTQNQNAPEGMLIVSDAGGNFDWTIGKRYSFIIGRNVRATDILMDRVSKLVPSSISSSLPTLRIDMGLELSRKQEETALPAEIQRSVRNIRTDLDRFSESEISALLRHGYSEARYALQNIGEPQAQTPHSWNITGQASKRYKFDIGEVKRRKLGLFNWRDVATWSQMMIFVGWILVIVGGPVILANWRNESKIQGLEYENAVVKLKTFVKTSVALDRVPGIDVYTYKTIDGTKLKKRGLSFVFVPANEKVSKTLHEARESGLLFGTYQSFDLNADPKTQADSYASMAEGKLFTSGNLPPVVEVDEIPLNVTGDRAAETLSTYLKELQQKTDRVPIIYTLKKVWTKIGNRPEFSRYPLWLGTWSTESSIESVQVPPPWSTWTFLQTSKEFVVPEVQGKVDSVIYNGSATELSAFCRKEAIRTAKAVGPSLTVAH
jgi:predicted acylesterase/phospholipase RssA/GH25 family lysozyme M1 (1,4-beta-N-acetylmuramidase)